LHAKNGNFYFLRDRHGMRNIGLLRNGFIGTYSNLYIITITKNMLQSTENILNFLFEHNKNRAGCREVCHCSLQIIHISFMQLCFVSHRRRQLLATNVFCCMQSVLLQYFAQNEMWKRRRLNIWGKIPSSVVPLRRRQTCNSRKMSEGTCIFEHKENTSLLHFNRKEIG
jgi:hypothetical protein